MFKNFLKVYITYRIPIICALIVGGILLQLYVDLITAILCYVAAGISIALYFMIGTMRLVQEAVQDGDVEKAQEYLNMIRFPRMLFKPIRAGYYALQSNLALTTQDLGKAEEHIQKSLKIKSSLAGETKGISLMQLGFIQLKKGNVKEGRENLLNAIKAGIQDNDSLAGVYMQLCSIEIHRNHNKIAKEYFRKAKALKPKAEEIASQIKMMEKQISRIPG